MKKFLLSQLVLIIIFFSINGIFLHHRNNTAYINSLKRPFIHKTFLFADSHGTCIKNNLIENLSFPSDNYKDIRLKIEFLLTNNVSIDTILLSADPHMLNTYRETTNNFHYSCGLEKYYLQYLPILEGRYTTSLPLRFKEKLSIYLRDNINETRDFNDLSSAEQTNAINIRFTEQFSGKNNSKFMQKELLAIFELCKTHNIVLYGIRFPVVPEFYKLIVENNIDIDDSIFPSGGQILDYSCTKIDINYFEDQDHLNEDGGEILLDKILTDIKGYRLP